MPGFPFLCGQMNTSPRSSMGFLNQYIDMPLQKFRRPVVVQIAVKKVYSYNAKVSASRCISFLDSNRLHKG